MNWILLSFELLALLSCGKAQNAVSVVSPAGLATQDGNTNTWYPFFPNSIRYQQVYSASEFSVLTNFGGGWILGILFRGDRYAWAVTFPSVQFNFSTTARGPDNLSSVFAENVGADDAVVFKGSLYAGAFAGMPSTWGPFGDITTNLFFYDPLAGNLLLDIRIYQGNSSGEKITELDASEQVGDPVSRVYRWGDVNASTGVVDTVGLVTRFELWPNPKLSVAQRTNSIILTWPANPYFFVLQSNADLGPEAKWQAVTSGILETNFLKTYAIPIESAGASRYFRLVSGPL